MKLSIVGLGPGPFSLITQAALCCMRQADVVYVQTQRHPAVKALFELGIPLVFIDELYQNAEDFDSLNQAVVQKVLSDDRGHIVFAASGHGIIGSSAVPMMLEKAKERDIKTQVYPGLGYEAAIAACRMDTARGYSVHIGALKAETLDCAKVNIVADVDSKLKASEAKIALMERFSDDMEMYIVRCEGEALVSDRIQLCMLDRQQSYDASTTLVVPPVPLESRQHFSATDLMEIIRILRSPNGCPWDREQTHLSIRRNMLEEACEAMAAISQGDDDHLCEELGDVLLQIALHAAMAQEAGAFDFTGVATGICQKMIRRHPHIFADEEASTSAEVLQKWENIKQQERNGAPQNPLRKIGLGLPSLMRAQELQKEMAERCADEHAAQQKVYAALADFADTGSDMAKQEQSAGLALWALCEWLLRKDIHAETALSDVCTDKSGT